MNVDYFLFNKKQLSVVHLKTKRFEVGLISEFILKQNVCDNFGFFRRFVLKMNQIIFEMKIINNSNNIFFSMKSAVQYIKSFTKEEIN